MKFIHAADLHLDSPFLGLTGLPGSLATTVRESTFTAATKVFDRALSEHVDFVLLAGDLFDRAEQSVAAQAFLFTQFDRLNNAQIPVIVSFGNHDYLTDQAIIYPTNVTVLGEHVTTTTLQLASGETVAVSGFSYPQRWVPDDPLAAYPAHATTDWHIGMLHGAIATGSQDHYAPFTVAELLRKRYDYWALGHIHHRQSLNDQPPVLYAGNTQGRAVTETGAKGAYLVHSQAGHLVPEFFPTATVIWETAKLALDGTNLVALNEALVSWLAAHPAVQPTLTTITLTTSSPLSVAEQQRLATGDWLQLFQRTHQRQLKAAQRYIVRLSLDETTATVSAPNLDQSYWELGAKTVFTAANRQELFGKLAQEPALAAWFDRPETAASLEAAARRRLTQLMGGEGQDES
ncbi:exonuclease SbcCD subunit D [Levilactobacillus yonginensis]|uniref:metallophosphoesterase family protein n=1 Tax=Levilactobacillus yonginensis TaxID=1054041 RepID=UPI00345DF6B7